MTHSLTVRILASWWEPISLSPSLFYSQSQSVTWCRWEHRPVSVVKLSYSLCKMSVCTMSTDNILCRLPRLQWDLTTFSVDYRCLQWDLTTFSVDYRRLQRDLTTFSVDYRRLQWDLTTFSVDYRCLQWDLTTFSADFHHPVRTNNIICELPPSLLYSQSLTYCRTEPLTFCVALCLIAVAWGCILTVVFTSNKL